MSHSSSRFLPLLLVLALTGCATKDPDIAFDPLEPLNRSVYGLNEGIDLLAVGPASRIYKEGVPSPIRTVFSNIFRNLEMPVIAINKLLQGDLSAAGTAVGRFMVNSTVGAAGIADIATGAGLPYEDTDFGVTLARWGAPTGPYLVLPLMGPSNLRDGVGIAVDYAADPVRIAAQDNPADTFYIVANTLRSIEARGGYEAVIDDARKNSIDSYAALRSYFSQHREAEIARQLGWTKPEADAMPANAKKKHKKKK